MAAQGLQVHDYSYGPQGLLWENNPSTIYTPGFGHRSNGINKFYHTDWLGSTRYTSDITGNGFPAAMRFDAYGNRSATGGTDPYHSTDKQFAGGWEYQTEWADATNPGLGLQYLQQRYYDPAVGRFISPDPIGMAGGTNLYAYCANNPVGMVDPSGEIVVPAAIGGALLGGLVGGVAGYWSSGGDWAAARQGAGRGALIGGIIGATGGAAAWAMSGVVGTSTAGTLASAGFGGFVGSAFGQRAEVAFGWRQGMSVGEAAASAGFAVVGAGGVRAFGAWRAARAARPVSGSSTPCEAAVSGGVEEYPLGSYTAFRRDPTTGRVSHYESYVPNEYAPGRFRPVKRFDGQGDAHFDKPTGVDVPTPHVHFSAKPGGPLSRARPPRPDELPRGY